MNKGEVLVLDILGSEIIVLTQSGEYLRAKRPSHCQIGEVVPRESLDIIKHRASSNKRKILAVAATFILCLSFASWYFLFPVQAATVVIDINPSLELYIDNTGRVSTVKSLNEDAANLVANLNIDGKSLDEALRKLMQVTMAEGYLQDSDNFVFTSIVEFSRWTTKLKHQRYHLDEVKLQETMVQSLDKLDIDALVVVQKATQSDYAEAVAKDTSVNKLLIAKSIGSKDIDSTVRQLNKQGIKGYAKGQVDEIKRIIPPGAKMKELKHLRHSNSDGRGKPDKDQKDNSGNSEDRMDKGIGDSPRTTKPDTRLLDKDKQGNGTKSESQSKGAGKSKGGKGK